MRTSEGLFLEAIHRAQEGIYVRGNEVSLGRRHRDFLQAKGELGGQKIGVQHFFAVGQAGLTIQVQGVQAPLSISMQITISASVAG